MEKRKVKRLKWELVSYDDQTSRHSEGLVGGPKTYYFPDIAGYEAETTFWSNDNNLEMDYAFAMASLNNETNIDGDKEFAAVLADQIYVAGCMVSKTMDNRIGRRYWIRWGKSQRAKALRLGVPEFPPIIIEKEYGASFL